MNNGGRETLAPDDKLWEEGSAARGKEEMKMNKRKWRRGGNEKAKAEKGRNKKQNETGNKGPRKSLKWDELVIRGSHFVRF